MAGDQNSLTAEPRGPLLVQDWHEIEHHVARAQELRAEATERILLRAGRGVARVLRPALAGLARWHRQNQTREALMRCSDCALADIGIERADIPLFAKGVDPAAHQPALRRWWAAARERLDAARAARRERRQLYRELDAYSDGELDEIGMRRSDIPAIAREHETLRRAA